MTAPYLTDDQVTVWHGDALDVLRTMPDNSVDSVCTDPPYGLEFMGKEWDAPWRSGGEAWNGELAQGADWNGRTRARQGSAYPRSKQKRCRACGRQEFSGTPCACPDPQWEGVMAAPKQLRAFQSWCEQWAAECLRVLRPGGHLLAFGGMRTQHRLGCAIEDAGFEIRDAITWLYACLTADAEVLTEHGWKSGVEVEAGERVAQWDPATGSVSLTPVLEVFRAPYDGPMRVLRNADTDQVLTPNHRVYHRPRQRRMERGQRAAWYEDRWEVDEAGRLSTWNPLVLPIAGEHDGPGIGGEDYAALLGWVWTEGGFDLSGTGVRVYQSSVNADKCDEIAALLDRLGPHKRYEQQRTYIRRNGQPHPHTATTWYFSGDLARRVRADLPGKRPTYDLLWRMTQTEKRALLRAALLGDGSHGSTGSWQFFQRHEDDLVWMQTLLALVGQAGKVGMRPGRDSGAVYLRNRSTTELQARHLRDAWQDYTGEVWCVRVPSGAFLARRNGKVFVTGNSGFPKNLDVSKAIDRQRDDRDAVLAVTTFMADHAERNGVTRAQLDEHMGTSDMGGWWLSRLRHRCQVPQVEQYARLKALLRLPDDMDAEVWRLNGRKGTPGEAWEQREVIGQRTTGIGTGKGSVAYIADSENRDVTAPATDAARQWQGWGTALKPAAEIIVVARKPLAGNVAQNVLAHGTGALNIGACRVAGQAPSTTGTGFSTEKFAGAVGRGEATMRGVAWQPSSAGRWPANLVLSHAPGCEQIGTRKVRTGTAVKRNRAGNPQGDSSWQLPGAPQDDATYADADGTETVPAFRCAPGCPVAELDAQSGQRVSGWRDTDKAKNDAGITIGKFVREFTGSHYSDSGGASRFFPTFRYEPKAAAAERPRVAQEGAGDPRTMNASSKTRQCNVCGNRTNPAGGVHSGKPWPTCGHDDWSWVEKMPQQGHVAHPTVKPLDLIRWLVRLVTPPGGIVLDPFAGSGTTGEACLVEGFRCVLIEREADYLSLIRARLSKPIQPDIFGGIA